MENKSSITDESLVYSINIFNANALQSINSSKRNSLTKMDETDNTRYVTPSLIIIPLCAAILSIIIFTDSLLAKIIIPFLIIFSMVIYILSIKKYDIMFIFDKFKRNDKELIDMSTSMENGT